MITIGFLFGKPWLEFVLVCVCKDVLTKTCPASLSTRRCLHKTAACKTPKAVCSLQRCLHKNCCLQNFARPVCTCKDVFTGLQNFAHGQPVVCKNVFNNYCLQNSAWPVSAKLRLAVCSYQRCLRKRKTSPGQMSACKTPPGLSVVQRSHTKTIVRPVCKALVFQRLCCLCSSWLLSFVCVAPKVFKHFLKHIVLVFLYLKCFKCHISWLVCIIV